MRRVHDEIRGDDTIPAAPPGEALSELAQKGGAVEQPARRVEVFEQAGEVLALGTGRHLHTVKCRGATQNVRRDAAFEVHVDVGLGQAEAPGTVRTAHRDRRRVSSESGTAVR